MRVNYVTRGRRSSATPERGITFTSAEKKRISELAGRLVPLGYDSLAVLRDALSHEAYRLEDAEEWAAGESEEIRKRQFEDTVIHYMAVWAAIARL
jgi:hypothetical protein